MLRIFYPKPGDEDAEYVVCIEASKVRQIDGREVAYGGDLAIVMAGYLSFVLYSRVLCSQSLCWA